MIRLLLRLIGALLVERSCERPDGWPTYHGPTVTGIKGPTQFSKPLLKFHQKDE